MQKSGDNVPCPQWEQNQNKWPPFRVSVTVCDGNHCSCRTQALSANMFNWKKNWTSATPCENVQVWNLHGIWNIWFHSIHQIFHSIPGPFHIPCQFFPSIPYHTVLCPDCAVHFFRVRRIGLDVNWSNNSISAKTFRGCPDLMWKYQFYGPAQEVYGIVLNSWNCPSYCCNWLNRFKCLCQLATWNMH